MSRIGKLAINIPKTVNLINNNSVLTVKGEFGTLERIIPETIQIEKIDNILTVSLKNETRSSKAFHGLYRTLINNMIIGVSEQFVITLMLQGVGYRANIQDQALVLNLGFSHKLNYKIPSFFDIDILKQNVEIKNCSFQKVKNFSSILRHYKSPEPYKGKGIRYKSEIVELKESKKSK